MIDFRDHIVLSVCWYVNIFVCNNFYLKLSKFNLNLIFSSYFLYMYFISYICIKNHIICCIVCVFKILVFNGNAKCNMYLKINKSTLDWLIDWLDILRRISNMWLEFRSGFVYMIFFEQWNQVSRWQLIFITGIQTVAGYITPLKIVPFK